MSAAAIILLILFLIGLGLTLYYTIVCLEIRPRKAKQYRRGDLGPLLESDADLNGNNEARVTVGPCMSIDEPDKSVHDDSLDDADEKNFDCDLLKNVSFQVTPICASKDPKADAVFLPIEDEPSTNTCKPVMAPVRRDLKPTFMSLNSDSPVVNFSSSPVRYRNERRPDTRSNCYEEDGLLVSPTQNLPLTVASAVLVLDGHSVTSPREQSSSCSSKETLPKKQVQFTTTPEEGTSIDEQICNVDAEKPIFRLHSHVNIPVEEPVAPVLVKYTVTPYPVESPFPKAVITSPRETESENVIVNPIFDNKETTAGPIGWVAPNDEDSNEDEESISPEKDSIKLTTVKVILPTEDYSPSTDDSDSSSDPGVTEYSFQTGPSVPSTATVLANEVGCYSDPRVTRFVSLSNGKALNANPPPTPSTESSMTGSSLGDQTIGEEDINDDYTDQNVLGTPPETPQNVLGTPPETPPGDSISVGFVIGNPAAKEISPRSDDSRERSGSTSSSMSTTSNSSTSSSSTNGSYRIQNLDKIDDSSDRFSNDQNVSKIPRLK